MLLPKESLSYNNYLKRARKSSHVLFHEIVKNPIVTLSMMAPTLSFINKKNK